MHTHTKTKLHTPKICTNTQAETHHVTHRWNTTTLHTQTHAKMRTLSISNHLSTHTHTQIFKSTQMRCCYATHIQHTTPQTHPAWHRCAHVHKCMLVINTCTRNRLQNRKPTCTYTLIKAHKLPRWLTPTHTDKEVMDAHTHRQNHAFMYSTCKCHRTGSTKEQSRQWSFLFVLLYIYL